jgi:site-specific recombinase XerD
MLRQRVDLDQRFERPRQIPVHRQLTAMKLCPFADKAKCSRRKRTVQHLVMRQAGSGPYPDRIRALIAILWRAGLRISEALALTESDLDPKTGSVLVRAGKGGKRRMVGMDDWGWEHVGRWTEHRIRLPIGPLFCSLAGPTRGRGWSATAARGELRRLAVQAGVRRRFAPHQLRHAHAIEMAHEGIRLPIIQRQLGHAHLGITSIYHQGIDTREIVETVHHRRPPVISASAGLRP